MDSGPAIAVIELLSIARGMTTLDKMIKKAPVRPLHAGVISPGKYLIVVHGDVASVEEAYLEALSHGGRRVGDHLFLPQAHEGLLPAMTGSVKAESIDSFGVVEALGAAATIHGADVCAKAVDVDILEIRFAKHLGGKGYFTMSGAQESVEAALDAASALLSEKGLLFGAEIINRPHEEFIPEVLPGSESELRRRS